jgi:HAD superfamily hydrolase (TIGR01549 family)
MPVTTVVFDLGETLVDETSLWQGWATWLGVSPFTLYAVIGGVVARGLDHTEFLSVLRPGEDHADLLAAKNAEIPWRLSEDDLYPDAVPCLRELSEEGWQVVVGGNQPLAFQQLVEQLDLPVDLVTSSGELGAAKPSAAFFQALAARAGVVPEQCVHVGDRVDNDVVGALAAGMAAVHLRRGPWGLLFDPDLTSDRVHQVSGLDVVPSTLRGIR